MVAVELWCVRHGEATHNVDFAVRGEAAYVDPRHANSDLTPRGKAPEPVAQVSVEPAAKKQRVAEA